MGPKPIKSGGTASFGNFTPKSELDLVILRAAESPAPGQYQPVNVPKRRKKLAELQKEFQVSTKAVMFAAKLRSKMMRKKTSRVVIVQRSASCSPAIANVFLFRVTSQ